MPSLPAPTAAPAERPRPAAPVRRGGAIGAIALIALAAAGGCARSAGGTQTPATLVVALGSDPGALNPAVTTSGSTHPVTDQIFNGLVGLDERLHPVPELAERWDVEQEGRVYRFHLRRGVRWHDGVPLTAADVKFTFEQALLRYHSRTRAGLEPIVAGIDTPDAHTVVFRLARPYGPLLQRLDVVEASIIPKHRYEGHDLLAGSPTREPIGTGPFRFVSRTPASTIVLERNPSYFRRDRPLLDRLVFRILPHPATAVAALEAAEIDYLPGLPGPDLARLRHRPDIAIAQATGGPGGSMCQDVLIPNLARPPFDDVRVRRALAHAIDRRFIVDRVYFGQGRPATGPISHLLEWAYTPDVRQYLYDPELAARRLDEAGWTRRAGGDRFALTFTHAPGFQRLGLVLREQLKKVGVAVRLETVDFNAAVEAVFVRKRFDLGVASYCNGPDPDIGVRRLYVSSTIGPYPFSNGAGYRHPEIDRLFDEAAVPLDRAARRPFYVRIQQILADEIPYFWLVDSVPLRAYRTAFTGFRLWTGAFAETVAPAPPATR